MKRLLGTALLVALVVLTVAALQQTNGSTTASVRGAGAVSSK